MEVGISVRSISLAAKRRVKIWGTDTKIFLCRVSEDGYLKCYLTS